MKRLWIVVGVAVAVALASVAVALADSDTVDPNCNGGGLGSCDGWFNEANDPGGSVDLHWDINPAPDTTAGCDDQTISAQGVSHVVCQVTWPDTTSTTKPVDVKLDTNPPADVAGLSRLPDSNGWYNHPVALDMVSGSSDPQPGSGLDTASCTTLTYSGPDDANASMTGHCSDIAGNVGADATPVTFQYDATPPTVDTASLGRPPDSNGWYNHPVAIQLTGTDATSGPVVCTSPQYSGPDGASVQLNGSCSDQAGNVAAGGTLLSYDSTPPAVRVTPDRPPDHNGWYNHPVSFAVTGTDTVSQVASCAGNTTYSGPQSGSAGVAGTCTDNAGNTGIGGASFKYDSTRPAAADVQVTPGNHRVDVSWSVPSDATSVTLVRAQQGSSAAPKVVYSGTRSSFVDTHLQNGVKYSYTVADIDQAGNSTTKTVRAIPTASSLRPYVGSVVSSAPLLTWKKVKRARYYNVQLYLGRTKVMSKWPRTASLQLTPRWHYRGKTYTLIPGHYRWYVWPGYGPLSAHRYGNRIGRSSFRVTG
jgi:hypothetical protein